MCGTKQDRNLKHIVTNSSGVKTQQGIAGFPPSSDCILLVELGYGVMSCGDTDDAMKREIVQ